MTTEFFRRRVPFGSAVERGMMGDYWGVAWEVTQVIIPPAAMVSVAAAIGETTASTLWDAYWAEELNAFIEEKRMDGDISIKGIYIKDPEDEDSFMEEIFGKENFVETIEFGEAVNKFVSIMTKTYREQRQKEKWKIRQNTIKGKTQL